MKLITAKANEPVTGLKVAVIVSLFNRDITLALQEGAVNRLQEKGVLNDNILLVEVPGAVEIPVVAKLLAQSQRCSIILALGAVIRGDTSHYDYVCEQVSQGCQRVTLDTNCPVVFGILTTENEQQAWDRLGGSQGHKGVEAADSALAMHSILQQLQRCL